MIYRMQIKKKKERKTVLLQCARWLMPCISVSRPATKFCRTWVNENNARLVLHAPIQDQKEVRAWICADLLHEAQNDATFVNSTIAEDESWCFQYDPPTKRQTAEWRSTGTPPWKKVRRQPSTTKTMIIVFFDAKGIVHHEFIPQRANGQPRSLHLRTQAHARGTSTSSSWPVGIWTVDSVAQCETTHSSNSLKISH